MKKFGLISLLFASVIGLSAVSMNERSFERAKADSVVYVDFGPGVFNPAQSITPEDRFSPGIYSIAYRGGTTEGALMLFPNKGIYEGIDFNTVVPTGELEDTNYTKVRIYTSETSYKTMDNYFSRGETSTSYNIYSDAAYNVSFFMDRNLLPTKDIYKITFDEGFIFPYASEDHSVKYVLKESQTFVNRFYQNSSHKDLVESSEWLRTSNTQPEDQGGEEEGIVLQDIAAFSRTLGKKEDYRLQIRGSNIKEEDFNIPGKLDIDDFTCKLFIFFGDNDYNPDLMQERDIYNIPIPDNKMDLSDSETSYLNTLYDRVLFTTEEGDTMTLRQVSDPLTKGLPIYNGSGECGCLVFKIGNFGDTSIPSYNAKDFSEVTILRGAQFPAYAYTSGHTTTEYRYQQVDDITVSLSQWRQTLWSTTATFSFNAADINITSVGARKVNVNTDSLHLNAVVVDIGLSESNYAGVTNQQIITLGEKMTRYVYVNGRSLYHAYSKGELSAYANLDGKEETISIVVPLNDPSEITEIIVQRGCSVPSLVASSITMEIYGGYVSYYVLSTASYALKNGEYQETEKIYWTLWFDSKNPIRVENAKTFDFENAPQGDNTERQRFVKWVNEQGEEASGFKRINDMSPKEFFGVYVYSQSVEFKNIDKEFSIMVERYTRLTNVEKVKDILVPKKKGYVFQGWVDEEGNHYNMDNRVTRDLVLTATWVSTTNTYSVNDNTGLLVATIIVASLTVLVIAGDVVLLILKKKKAK